MNLRFQCYYCKSTAKELRPYGPNGAFICFDCAFATPEAKAETERNFELQLAACGQVAVIGTEVGPYPLNGLNPERFS